MEWLESRCVRPRQARCRLCRLHKTRSHVYFFIARRLDTVDLWPIAETIVENKNFGCRIGCS
jgi:hypothetical protein